MLGLTVVFSGMVLLDLPLLGRGRAPFITLLQRHIPSRVCAATLSLLMGCVSLACGRLIAYYYAFEF